MNRDMIATLKGDMDREKAEIGVFATLQPSTEPMRRDALSASIYTSDTSRTSSIRVFRY